MKKLFLISILLLIASPIFAEAGILDKVENYIKDNTQITGVIYTDKSDLEEVIGTTIVRDLYLEKLDISALYDLDKMLGLQADYTLKETDTLAIYVGGGIGLDKIENENNIGETIYFLGGGVKF